MPTLEPKQVKLAANSTSMQGIIDVKEAKKLLLKSTPICFKKLFFIIENDNSIISFLDFESQVKQKGHRIDIDKNSENEIIVTIYSTLTDPQHPSAFDDFWMVLDQESDLAKQELFSTT